MQRTKPFFVVCAGIFLLALAYHLGARPAGAQAPGNPVVGSIAQANAIYYGVVVTANGDVHAATTAPLATWTHVSNVFTGPTPAQPTTFGAIKARFRK